MRRYRIAPLFALLALAACANVLGYDDIVFPPEAPDAAIEASTSDAETEAAPKPDVAVDASTTCDPRTPFVESHALPNLHVEGDSEGRPSLEADELTIYFHRAAGGGARIYRAQRSDRNADFGAPAEIPAIGAWQTLANASLILTPTVTGDGSHLYFRYFVNSSLNTIAVSYRPPGDDFHTPVGMGGIMQLDEQPFVTADGGHLLFLRNDAGVFAPVTYAPDAAVALTPPVLPMPPGSGQINVLSADEQTLIFTPMARDEHISEATIIPDGSLSDIAPVNTAGALNSPSSGTTNGWLSPDNCRFYFASDYLGPPGTARVHIATR